jgi:hypothetical protein
MPGPMSVPVSSNGNRSSVQHACVSDVSSCFRESWSSWRTKSSVEVIPMWAGNLSWTNATTGTGTHEMLRFSGSGSRCSRAT